MRPESIAWKTLLFLFVLPSSRPSAFTFYISTLLEGWEFVFVELLHNYRLDAWEDFTCKSNGIKIILKEEQNNDWKSNNDFSHSSILNKRHKQYDTYGCSVRDLAAMFLPKNPTS